MNAPSIVVEGLTFHYNSGEPAVLHELQLTLQAGDRCLLVGANGAGKTTLLRVLGGKHMIDARVARVLGSSAFHDTKLVGRVVFLGGTFPFDLDVRVGAILERYPVAKHRRRQLIDILGVDIDWRMHRVSDGQRRRVQLLLGLLPEFEVLLLDEITTDLDLVARCDLLTFLRQECELRGVTVLYATHIFDRLEQWATHVAFVEQGRLHPLQSMQTIKISAAYLQQDGSLSRLVESWLRKRS